MVGATGVSTFGAATGSSAGFFSGVFVPGFFGGTGAGAEGFLTSGFSGLFLACTSCGAMIGAIIFGLTGGTTGFCETGAVLVVAVTGAGEVCGFSLGDTRGSTILPFRSASGRTMGGVISSNIGGGA